MPKRVAIIGAGRVGRTLGRKLRLRGYRIEAVVTRSLRTARVAVKFIGAGRASRAPGPELLASDFVLICVPDDTVAKTARALAKIEGSWRGKVVLHTSGALSSRALAPLKRRGASVGSLHPVYPFPQPMKNFPAGVVFGIEGTPAAVREARRLVRSLRGAPVRIRPERKTLYHASAALVSGHLVALLDLGAGLLREAGVPRAQARRSLLPLIERTVAEYARRGSRAWTGPLERGDVATVREHLKALRGQPRFYREAYLALALAAVELYRPPGGKAAGALKKILKQGKGR